MFEYESDFIKKINYKTLRHAADAEFNWSVSAIHYAFIELSDIDIKEYYTDAKAFTFACSKKNREKIQELFGTDVDVKPYAPAILYGHLSALGFELVFPEGGEVFYKKRNMTLDESIRLFDRKPDYQREGYYPVYKKNLDRIQTLLPDDHDALSMQYSTEGPTTLAYEILNQDVFYQPYDDPEKFKVLQKRIVESIVDFRRFQSAERGRITKKTGSGLYDDIAAMFSPDLWDEFVLPYWDIYFNELCEKERFLHCEDMTVNHLAHLEKLGITYYEPAISAKLNPIAIRNSVRMPFSWKLESFHYPDLSIQDVRDWVLKAAADGASRVWTVIGANMMNEACASKVKEFIRTVKEVESMIQRGVTRQEIGKMVSEAGRRKFWAKWP